MVDGTSRGGTGNWGWKVRERPESRRESLSDNRGLSEVGINEKDRGPVTRVVDHR